MLKIERLFFYGAFIAVILYHLILFAELMKNGERLWAMLFFELGLILMLLLVILYRLEEGELG